MSPHRACPVGRQGVLCACLVAFATLIVPLASPAAAPSRATGCTRVASPDGSDAASGTFAAPYRTAQRLADALRPGEVGCLRGGSYAPTGRYGIRVGHGGGRGRPITIRSFPGERATVHGTVYVVNGSNWVRLTGLNVVGTGPESAVEVFSSDVVVAGNDITNASHDVNCLILGSNEGWGQAVRTVIRANRIHDCGTTHLDHGIYLDNTSGVAVVGNLIWNVAGFGVQIYPNAQNTLVKQNVIFRTGNGGIIFGGEGSLVSSGNVVTRNIVSQSEGAGIRGYWNGAVGTGNVAVNNCVWATAEPLGDQGGFAASATVLADPRFRNAGRHDFRLEPGSPCLRVAGYDIAATLAR